MSNLPLFDDRKIGNLSREVLSQKLSSLADEGIYIGTSSWKYEGWLGQIYCASKKLRTCCNHWELT